MAYPFRMFGVRTILIGVDLLARDPEVRRHAVRPGPADPRLGHDLSVGRGQVGRVTAEGREDDDDHLGGQPRTRADRQPQLAPLRTQVTVCYLVLICASPASREPK